MDSRARLPSSINWGQSSEGIRLDGAQHAIVQNNLLRRTDGARPWPIVIFESCGVTVAGNVVAYPETFANQSPPACHRAPRDPCRVLRGDVGQVVGVCAVTPSRIRRLTASLIVMGLAALSIARTATLVREVRPYYQPGWEDEVTRFERTVAPVRAHLGSLRRIGYVAGVPPDELMTPGQAEATWRYFMAQYAVAPVIVARRSDVTPLLADLGNAEALASVAAARGYRIVWQKDGFGLLDAVPR